MNNRTRLLHVLDEQRADLERCADVEQFDRYRQGAISLLTDRRVRDAAHGVDHQQLLSMHRLVVADRTTCGVEA